MNAVLAECSIVNVSTRVEYAVRALLYLAAQPGSSSVAAIAESQNIPRKFLEAILADLRRDGLVTSQRGPAGGYQLAQDPSEVSIGEIFRAVDGPLARVHGLRPHETSYEDLASHLPKLWVALRVALRQVLDDVSLEDVLSGRYPEHIRQLLTAPDAWQNR